ncbi:MAG: efflux RND transporter periplasmic adaptor subunit [Candidatus Polarisedimenticolia bacterium]
MPGQDGREPYLDVFRREALENLVQGRQRQGEPLRISPAWTGWTYWVLVAFFVIAVLFLLVGRIGEYAEGPAVVKIEGRREITAVTGGTVTSVDVQPGETVGAGQPMVRLYDRQESAELERTRREFELLLVSYLKNPSDAGLRQSLIALRGQKDLAESRLEQRIVRAPEAGSVGDLHVRPGQVVAAGDMILSLLGPAPAVSVIAMLPGSYRPQLALGMPLRLELLGYRYAYEATTIEAIGDEVIGPQAARRYLGPEIADTVSLTGPVVVVRARLLNPTFMTDQQVYDLHDGMLGRAAVRVRSQSLLVMLVPSLKALFEERRG